MKVLFISLGCDKNLVDSEHMSGILSNAGHEFTEDEMEADVIIINSHALFMMPKKKASIQFLRWQYIKNMVIVRHWFWQDVLPRDIIRK